MDAGIVPASRAPGNPGIGDMLRAVPFRKKRYGTVSVSPIHPVRFRSEDGCRYRSTRGADSVTDHPVRFFARKADLNGRGPRSAPPPPSFRFAKPVDFSAAAQLAGRGLAHAGPMQRLRHARRPTLKSQPFNVGALEVSRLRVKASRSLHPSPLTHVRWTKMPKLVSWGGGAGGFSRRCVGGELYSPPKIRCYAYRCPPRFASKRRSLLPGEAVPLAGI